MEHGAKRQSGCFCRDFLHFCGAPPPLAAALRAILCGKGSVLSALCADLTWAPVLLQKDLNDREREVRNLKSQIVELQANVEAVGDAAAAQQTEAAAKAQQEVQILQEVCSDLDACLG